MTTMFKLPYQFIGSDYLTKRMQEVTDAYANSALTHYPPYNIKKLDDDKYVIEMAVAGFAKSDIEITLDGDKLIIKGNSKDNEGEQYLYQGIANRAFERTFTLNDKVEIKDAEMVNGMLKVFLENIVKTQDAIKKIGIKSKDE